MKRELEGGWFQWMTLPLPALLTIQSGINQLRYATLKGIMAAKKKEIRKVTPAAAASPAQKILAIHFPEKGKKTQMLPGSPAEAAKELSRQAAGRSEGDPVILVVAEQREGKLNRASWEAIAAAQQIGGELKIALLGSGVDGVASELAAADVAEVVVVDAPALEHYTSDGQVVALAGVIAQESPSHVLLPHTYQTRDFAPALAARLQRALITDVTAVKAIRWNTSLVYVRPVFQGKMSAEVSAEGPAPHFITCQIGAFRADAVKRGGSPAAVRKAAIELDAAKIRQKPEAPFKEAKQAVDLSQAERIVAVGRGIKGQEHLKLVEQLAQALGAEIAASRPICDAGWLPMDRQIGSSGQTVAPKLYLALGISGAIQHLVGMKGARTIVAINKDPEAPIFEIADYGIEGDLFEVVPALIAELKLECTASTYAFGVTRRHDGTTPRQQETKERRVVESSWSSLWASCSTPLALRRHLPRVDLERETLEVDILIVGGGPAGMSAALRLSQLQKEQGGDALSIAVLEKSREPGAHMLSGAVLDPSALKDLIPDFKEKGAPLAAEVHHDHIYFLTRNSKIPFPITPPPLRNHGNYIISVNRFVKWMAGLVEAEGIDLFSGFPAAELLYEGARVVGVRTRDQGIDKHGVKKSTFEPGVDIKAKVTILCDGVRGNLTKALVRRLALDEGRLPQIYALGIKELWEVPKDRIPAGTVIHTMGYPLRMEEFGGCFLYAMPEGMVSVGLVSGLDYRDPMFDPHITFQHAKQHPLIEPILRGGQMIRYGAKALPEGGWHTIPRVYADGVLIAGDAGGFMNSMRLKGLHLAMRTGMLAAETAFAATRANDTSSVQLSKYEERINNSDVRRELYPVRNVHQSFSHGLLPGLMYSGLSLVTGGWWVRDPMPVNAGYEHMAKLADYYGDNRPDVDVPARPAKIDRQLTFDKLTNVHYSGTRHAEDQPSHLIVHDTDICRTRCREEYGNPCTRFCPANVYEMVDAGDGTKKLQINASNCVHCKTCDIMDPYQVIDWVPPEGGGGPQYEGM